MNNKNFHKKRNFSLLIKPPKSVFIMPLMHNKHTKGDFIS